LGEAAAMDEEFVVDPSPADADRYFHTETQDGVTVVIFEDIQIGPDARDPIYGLVENQGKTRIVVDLGDVWALSSHALGILANFQNKVRAAGGALKLCGVNPNLAQLFRLTKFDQIFEIHGTRDEAVRAF
jgi:anti-anti-sigma factor